jgi:8-oxo-dGTP pyrophosphatase MutT (NUDIX family)
MSRNRTRRAGPEDPVRLRFGAKALVASSDRYLLVEERHADGSAFWTLPGGGIHPNESPAAGLRREVREELSCRCLVGDRVTRLPYAHLSLEATVSLYTVFECRLLSEATPDPTEGVFALRWADPADPPAGTLPQVRQTLRSASGREATAGTSPGDWC